MAHKFVVLKDDVLLTFTDYDLIPAEFDHLIEFIPEIPPPPHTDQDHDEIDAWVGKFDRLMEIENARSSSER
jgi:hypothetical protein